MAVGVNVLACVLVLLLVSNTGCGAFEMRAYFNTGGVSGYISYTAPTFSTPGTTTPVRLSTLELKGYPQAAEAILWHIHDQAYTPGTNDLCGAAATGGPWDPDNRMSAANYSVECKRNAWHECALGDLYGKLGPLRPRTFIDASGIRLIDLLGRAVVLHRFDGTRFACANFIYTETPNSGPCFSTPAPSAYVARFVYPVAGWMMFRYYFSTATTAAGYPTALSAQLYDVTGNASQFWGDLAWTAHGSRVTWNDTLTWDPSKRCANAGPVLSNGNMSDTLNITLKVAATPSQWRQVLPYSDPTVASGSDIKSIVIWKNGWPVACANVHAVHPLDATARFGVSTSSPDYVRFTQASPFDTPTRTINVTGNPTSAYVGVRTAPVQAPTSAFQSGSSGVCSVTKSLYNPTGTTDSAAMTGGARLLNTSTCDETRNLYGPNSILGRSVTIESNSQPSVAQQCATLQQNLPAGAWSLLARVSMASDMPISGDIYLWQAAYADGTHSETKLIMPNLRGASATSNHNFHVHMNRVPPYPNGKSPCAEQYSSSHFNPFGVNSSAATSYPTACGPHAQMRCEVGDLSGKTGRLSVDGTSQIRTAEMLPLQGSHTILGRSIVIHSANAGAARIACGNVIDSRSADASVSFVTTPSFDRSDFVALASQATGSPQSTFQYVKAFSDPATRCTTVSFNVMSDNSTHSGQIASDLRSANLNRYTHQAKCDYFADSASTLALSVTIVTLSAVFALLFQ